MLNMENHISTINQKNNNNILNDIEIIKNGMIKIKNGIKIMNISKDIVKGFLIRLNCGHNTIFSGKEENIVVEILENINFLK